MADNDELKQWLKGRSVVTPIGSIKGDAAKATFAWGVQGLPWLILADKDHTVTAGGLGTEPQRKEMAWNAQLSNSPR